ncbi:hypothetical protein A8144_00090 [Mycobacterium leprae 3125609]|nr:hypothetical protein A8144_00090 [Mycobacterium leprae 3125609]OAX72203.1 hypothetical protein A3216_00150 [Mycobacterium leprae 7935681]
MYYYVVAAVDRDRSVPRVSISARPNGSLGRRGNRNHHTFIGAPKLRGVSAIAERMVDGAAIAGHR